MFTPDKKQAHRSGNADGLLGRACKSPYRQHWLSEAYMLGYMAGKKYREENNITLEVPGITEGATNAAN